jgi:hypothetical protein
MKLNLDMYNAEIYKHVQLEIPYNVGCAKITKSDIVVNSVNFQNDFVIFMDPQI